MRDLTRDVVRGLTVFEMEMVNHSNWRGVAHADVRDKSITYADTVFPTFAFLSGMSPTPWRRNVALVGLGIAYNSAGNISKGRDFQPRLVGVLQRTGLASLVFNAFPTMCPRYVALVTGLWTAVSIGLATNKQDPFDEPQNTAQTAIDKSVLGEKGLYRPDYDPEGLLGSLMTSVSMWFGAWYAQEQLDIASSIKAGSITMAAGTALSYLLPKYFPLSKPLWTPSFTLVTAGYSMVKYAAVSALLPYLPKSINYFLTCMGRRSIEVFFSSAVLHNVLNRWNLWSRAKEYLAQYIGYRAAEFALVACNNALMVYLATIYVKYGVRIRL